MATTALPRGAILWRRWLLALCALALVVAARTFLWLPFHGLGDYSDDFDRVQGVTTALPFVRRVTEAPPRGPWQVGELLDYAAASTQDRYRFWYGPLPGERLTLPVRRGERTLSVTIVGRHRTYFGASFLSWQSWPFWLAGLGQLWMLFFAGLFAWRRPESPEARVLTSWLILLPLATDLSPNNWMSPWFGLDAALNIVSRIIIYGGPALVAAYAMLFARPPSLARRTLAWLSYASAVIAAGIGIAQVYGLLSLAFDPRTPFFSNPSTFIIAGTANYRAVLPCLLSLLCVFATAAASSGAERTRLTWAMAPLSLYYVVAIVEGFVGAIDPSFDTGTLFLLANCTQFLVPLGLAYSLLNRRLLDIRFALNRAAIFSGVSMVIVGAFILGEWLISEWMRNASHTTNLAATGALALGLGLSIHVVHTRVEHVVDNVFFRKRRDDEEAIRTFAREAPYITDRETLLARTADVLSLRADASLVYVLLHDERGSYGSVSENDPAIVALRAHHAVLDLHTVPTAVKGEFAYPMAARGRLVGALVLGPKRSAESYAPDESTAIGHLAHAVAGAVDVLSLKEKPYEDELRQAVAAMTNGLSTLTAGISALTEEVRKSVLRG